MATTTRRLDGSHPLSRFYGLINWERNKAADAVRRDASALRILYEGGLDHAYWRAYHLATARGCTDASGKPVRWPRVWTRQDEKRFRHLYLGEGSTMPWARTVRLLKRIDGPDGGESPRLRFYTVALYGSPKPLEARIVKAFETHEAFLEAVRLAAESGHAKVDTEEVAAWAAAGELFNHLPPGAEAPPDTPTSKRESPEQATLKAVAALIEHHGYVNEWVKNYSPIKARDLTNAAGNKSPETASKLFRDIWGSHAAYKRSCEGDADAFRDKLNKMLGRYKQARESFGGDATNA